MPVKVLKTLSMILPLPVEVLVAFLYPAPDYKAI